MWVNQLATLISSGPAPTAASARLIPSAFRQSVTSWFLAEVGTGADSVGTCPSHRADEANTRHGADEALLVAAIANRLARSVDPLVSVDSETMRPFQTPAIRSSLLTTRSRFCTT
jgi:hypothetical protein